MIEVASGNIQPGVKYTIGNISTPPGTGTITYNSVVYAIGSSFVGQYEVTTYTSTLTAKVYEDDTLVNIQTQVTKQIENEISPYPENISIQTQVTYQNFSDTDNIIYPEYISIQTQVTKYRTLQARTQIIRKT